MIDTMDIAQSDLFGFPLLEQNVKPKSALRQLVDATNTHGPLATPAMVAAALGVSRQRIHQLIEQGRLATVNVGSERMIPAVALDSYWTDERKNGRPPKSPQLSKLVGTLAKITS